jgi:hypothetical protein
MLPVLRRYFFIGKGKGRYRHPAFPIDSSTIFGFPMLVIMKQSFRTFCACFLLLIGQRYKAMSIGIDVSTILGAAFQWRLEMSGRKQKIRDPGK